MGNPENTSQTEQLIRRETLRRLEGIYRAYNEAGIEVQPTGVLSRKVMRAVRQYWADDAAKA